MLEDISNQDHSVCVCVRACVPQCACLCMVSISPPPQVEQDVVNLTTAKVQFSEDSKVMIDVSLPTRPP